MARAFDREDDESKDIDRIKIRDTSTSSSTPVLDNFGRDLTALAMAGKLDPVIGRESEIQQISQILNKRKKNNPLIVGEAGVGKSCLVEGLAIKIVNKQVDRWLINKRLIGLNMSNIVSGTKYRGEFESRMKEVLEELSNNEDVILFIDEIHTVIGAGAATGGLDAANIIKPALSRGEMRCIGATTLDEFKKTIENDSALERRFQKVVLDVPSKEETLKILKQSKYRYEAYHGVKYSEGVLKSIVDLSDRYITYKNFPDKAIDIMDEVGSSVKMRKIKPPKHLTELEEQNQGIIQDKMKAVSRQEYENAAKLRDESRKVQKYLEEEYVKWDNDRKKNKIKIVEGDVSKIISRHTGIPLDKISVRESEKLLKLKKVLSDEVIGQDHAIEKVVNAIQRSRSGIQDPNKPFAAIFLGPTGVGKTLLAKAIAKHMFDNKSSFIRLDMSEYMEKTSVSKIIGSPPGYVGYEEKGGLTQKIRQNPYSLILLDEIEKAHPDVFHILLQVLDEGRATDSHGFETNFKNCIIIMTSNIGTDRILNTNRLGFSAERTDIDIEDEVMTEMSKKFKPELINRIDEKIVFFPIKEEDVGEIVDIELGFLKERLKEKNITLTVSKSLRDILMEKGYDKKFGARPLKRIIVQYIENELSRALIAKEIKEGDNVTMTYNKKEEKVVINVKDIK